MKIGIMSMQRIINYGSWLQAYGLKSTLESMGHRVEFVDYLAEPSLVSEPAAAPRQKLLARAKGLLRMLLPSYRDYRRRQIRMNQSFSDFMRRFNEEFLPTLGVSEQLNLCPELDALVIGSDEVFNCTQPSNAVGYSLQLFGRDHRAKKLLSYAASFGSTTLEKLELFGVQKEIGDRLAHFDAISVRDENSARIVTELCGTAPVQNIDPVLLYEFPEVDEIEVPHRDYIIVYAYAGRIKNDEAQAIRDFAAKYGKKVLSLGFYQPFCDEYVQATPLEVLAYVKHADYIVTDTFHGTVFSIKYQKRFATIIRDSNNNKLTGLLNMFRLDSHCVSALCDMERILNLEPDLAVPAMIAAERERAKKYLQNNI